MLESPAGMSDELERTPAERKLFPQVTADVEVEEQRAVDECRFQDKRLHNGMGSVEFDFKGSTGPPKYRQRMDQKDSLKSIRAKMSALVSVLEPVLRDEYLHITSNIASMHHPLDPSERALCDVCFSDLFSRARFCRSCGFELPHCSIDENPTHEQDLLVPVSRFRAEDIQTLLEQMGTFSATFSASSPPSMSLAPLPRYLASTLDWTPADFVSPHHQVQKAAIVPVICEGILSMKQIFLTPAYFMQTFGEENVDLIDCESGVFKEGTLDDILRLYDTPRGPHDRVLKVKDWPSQDTFRDGKFAELYEEFEYCLPFPNLTRLNGRDNLAAHFPDNAGLPPDLGPKVYFALAAKQGDGHHGSTRLHCDLTDAVNVCVFAAQQSDGSPGGARWDIFSPEDTMRLRKVLRAHTEPEDPVFAQNTYLTPAQLHELERNHNVKPYTFFQHEGEAVFIPAGCAHQVSNVTNAIKIACDFVSTEHLSTTIGLVSTFRQDRISKRSGDDVLQVYTTLLHAWCSLVRFHELYSKHHDMDLEGCDEDLSTLGPLAVDANSFDEAINVQTDHAPPHVTPIRSGPSPTKHGSQSRRRRKAGSRRKGGLSCPISSCSRQNFARVGLLDHINDIHTEYRMEGDVLKRLRDVVSCSLEEFLMTISDHVDKRHKLLEKAIG
ncbi:hypothetical protein BJY52DRAFT_1193828 [Lactarius psammicola]|nr:hypothetical protein BJY52DRAFT_1193828 [Lactarius psammicola]